MLTNRRPLENNEPGYFLRRINPQRIFLDGAPACAGPVTPKARRSGPSHPAHHYQTWCQARRWRGVG